MGQGVQPSADVTACCVPYVPGGQSRQAAAVTEAAVTFAP